MSDSTCPCGTLVLAEARRGRKRKLCTACSPVRKRPPKPKRARTVWTKNCVCGAEFTTTQSTAKYCSDKCRYEVSNAKRGRVRCRQCGGPTGYHTNYKQSPKNPACSDCIGRSKWGRRSGPCSTDGCEKDSKTGSRGMCNIHYQQSNPPCTLEGCDRPILGRGLCATHYNAWHRNQRKYTVVCPACGNTAQVRKKHLKHCSYECSMKSVAASKRGMTVEEWLIAGPKPRTGRLTAIERAQRKLDKAAKGKRGRTIWIDRSCKVCSRAFITQSSSTGRCCSEICTKKNKREILHRKMHRRRARKLDAFIEDVDRLVVFERDGYRCHICGKRTHLYPNKAWHPRKATVDHVIPLAATAVNGGVHSYANCRTACAMCNSAKSDRGGGEQLALSF